MSISLPVFTGPTSDKRIISRVYAQRLAIACQSYQLRYGKYPSGTPSEIATALQGSNLEGAESLDLRLGLNNLGVPVDAWGSPMQIIFRSENVVVTSAGKDKKLGTRDDISVQKPGVMKEQKIHE